MELIIEESRWEPLPYPHSATVGVRVGLPESDVRRRIKDVGGKWDPQRGLWMLRYDQVVHDLEGFTRNLSVLGVNQAGINASVTCSHE